MGDFRALSEIGKTAFTAQKRGEDEEVDTVWGRHTGTCSGS